MSATRSDGDDRSATPAGAPFQPASLRLINTAAEIKALADPLRTRVIGLLMANWQRSWSAKEIAGELGQATTKLYHHLKMLEAAGLITDVESRLVSGIVEHRYQPSQRSLQFDQALFGSLDTRPDTIAQLAAVIDTTRDDLLDFLSRDDTDYHQVLLSKVTARLTAEEISHIEDVVGELVDSYRARRDDPERAAVPLTVVTFLMHPSAHDSSHPLD
jgi:DNA-binding transcriptional ArsR family regulator